MAWPDEAPPSRQRFEPNVGPRVNQPSVPAPPGAAEKVHSCAGVSLHVALSMMAPGDRLSPRTSRQRALEPQNPPPNVKKPPICGNLPAVEARASTLIPTRMASAVMTAAVSFLGSMKTPA